MAGVTIPVDQLLNLVVSIIIVVITISLIMQVVQSLRGVTTALVPSPTS